MLRVNVLGIRKPLDFHLGIPVAATEKRPALVDGADPRSRHTVYSRPAAAFMASKKMSEGLTFLFQITSIISKMPKSFETIYHLSTTYV